jgi:hypothetical protein
VRAAWRRVEPLIATKRAAAALVLVSLVVYWVESLAWPFERGRDAWDYMTYYLSLFDAHTPFTEVMLFRTPVTPIAIGVPLSIGGVTALEIAMALFFAVSVLAWSLAALTYSRLAAVLVAGALLVSPGFALSFHEASSDSIATLAFALFAFGLVRTSFRPSAVRFAALGVGAGIVALTRPAYLGLVVGLLVPLCVRGSWRSRLAWGGAYFALALVVLGSWAGLNDLRYGDFTISRLSTTGRSPLVVPVAGPASRRLTAIVRRDVLSLPPYRRLHVTAETYFHNPLPEYEWIRLLGIADRVGGIQSDFRLLRDAETESASASRARLTVEGGSRGRGKLRWTARSMWRFVSRPANRDQTHLKPPVWSTPERAINAGGSLRPNPEALPPSIEAITFGFFPCASNEIARCILTDPSKAYSDPSQARRYAAVTRQVSRWDAHLGTGHPNAWVALQLDRTARHFPPPWLWLIVAGAALVVRRVRGGGALVALVGLAGVVLFVHAWAIGWVEAYAYPVLPAAVFAAVCAAVGERREEGGVEAAG